MTSNQIHLDVSGFDSIKTVFENIWARDIWKKDFNQIERICKSKDLNFEQKMIVVQDTIIHDEDFKKLWTNLSEERCGTFGVKVAALVTVGMALYCIGALHPDGDGGQA